MEASKRPSAAAPAGPDDFQQQPAPSAGAAIAGQGPAPSTVSAAMPIPFSKTIFAGTTAAAGGASASGATGAAGSFTAVAPGSPAAGAACSPGAVLAASLVRSRASYFERISSGARASTSGPGLDAAASTSTVTAGDAAAASPAPSEPSPSEQPPPTPRHSAMLAPHPLHPLAQHPLSRRRPGGGGSSSGGGGGAAAAAWSDDELSSEDDDSDGSEGDESADTFFDRPSYTRYGNVELSAAASYSRTRDPPAAGHGGSGDDARARQRQRVEQPGGGGGGAAAAASDPAAASAAAGAPSPVAELAAMGTRGYVRSLSARFGRVSAGSGGGGGSGGGRGMDGLFDELVAHVGALLASHPDAEAQMGMVQALSDRLLQLHEECERLERKEDEVEHLRGVLRELTSTRAEAIRLKVQMAESLNGLQQEYYKVLRSAQLAQSTAKQHAARAASTRRQLLDAQAELGRHKRANATLRRRNRALRDEAEELAARLAALERARAGGDGRHSACYMTLMRAQAGALY